MDRGVDRKSRKDGALWLCRHDGILTFGYILPRLAPVHNPYYSALLFYACALSFKELNKNHLHIYPYPMSPTSMSESCR